MKVLLLGIFLSSTSLMAAAQVSFPHHEKFKVDTKEWKITKHTVKKESFFTVTHKKDKELEGKVIKGPDMVSGLCAESTKENYLSCLSLSSTNKGSGYQIIVQKKKKDGTFEHFFFTFMIPTVKERAVASIIQKFKSDLNSSVRK